jgi:DNA topoisomerase-1
MLAPGSSRIRYFQNQKSKERSLAQNVVIVESPAKAKTINKYLGSDYMVVASFGHVRDLVNKDGSVVPEDDFAMKWELSEKSAKPLSEIKKALKGARALFLATDPDREGEAISWHVQEILQEKDLLKNMAVRRVTFNEITKKAVQAAFKQARDLDGPLIEAYLARRALDYLVGFSISPILWRKLPGARSAGRVQSVALRLVCERETEIEKFVSEEYWSIDARLKTPDGAPFSARLSQLDAKKLDKMALRGEAQAKDAVARIRAGALSVAKVEKKQVRRNPWPPFITSTLQMEASRKLRLSAAQTMRLAQRLYEGVDIKGETVGLITYMRTDGTTLSEDAVAQCRDVIRDRFGPKYLPDAPRLYKTKAKNAQEAHEAIRPTDLTRLPEEVAAFVDDDMAKLYDLIWKRTMASQMENAVLDQVGADIANDKGDVVLRASGSTVAFDGFLTLYHEDKDEESEEDEENRRLPPLAEGMKTPLVDVLPEQHFTQPPPRYSEATLVKKLEELGIGRPSTYASILQVLRDRNYVTLENRRFVPEDRGRLVTSFLSTFFTRYVDYGFTAGMEEELDAIANGHVAWKEALRQFWKDFSAAVEGTKDLTITQVIDTLDAELGPHFFPPREDGSDPRACPACSDGRLSLRLGKFGAFVGCSKYPDCRYTRPLVVPAEGEGAESEASAQLGNAPKILGNDPLSGRTVTLRRGPYGPYVQIDPPPVAEQSPAAEPVQAPQAEPEPPAEDSAAEGKKKKPKKKAKAKKPEGEKPKRQGLPRGMSVESVDLATALKLLSLPREVGTHPETGKVIQAGIGRFGPYLKHDEKYKSVPKDDDVLTIGINRAVDLLAQAKEGGGRKGGWKKRTPAPPDNKTARTVKAKGKPKKAGGKTKAPSSRAGAA